MNKVFNFFLGFFSTIILGAMAIGVLVASIRFIYWALNAPL